MEYQELMELEHMEQLAEHTYDASEFLIGLYDRGKLNTHFGKLSGRYMYHAPCHLRAQGIGRPSLELLRMIPGIEIEDADAGCCGQSGTYGFQVSTHDIAMTIGEPVFERFRDYAPDAIVSDCSGCRMQIAQATGFPAVHPLTLLRKSYEATR